jgi:hypothetical protein
LRQCSPLTDNGSLRDRSVCRLLLNHLEVPQFMAGSAGMPPPGDPLQSQREMLAFLRAEADANRTALRNDAEATRNALRQEADASRGFLRNLFAIAAIPAGVAIAVSGFLFAHDLNTLKQSLESTAQADIKVDIGKENKKIEDKINGELNQQFQSDRINKMITKAAQQAVDYRAPDLIQRVITPKVQDAVNQQSGKIQQIASQAATDKVNRAIDPLARQAQESVANLHVQELIFRAGTDDAVAFDELTALQSPGPSQSAGDLVKREIVDISQRITLQIANLQASDLNDCGGILSKTFPTSPVRNRTDMVMACIAWRYEPYRRKLPGDAELVSPIDVERRAVPSLINLVVQDPSLEVRGAALMALNTLFSMSDSTPANGIGLGR